MADEPIFRLWNPQWHNCTNMVPVRKDKDGHYPMTFEILANEAASAVAQIGTAADNALDGTTTPVLVYVVSSSADDTDNATKHARRVHLIGLSVASATDYINGDEDAVYSVEEIALAGATDVITTRYYLRVMHLYVCLHGSGDADAAGNIICEDDTDGTTTYLTIDAASNESNSSGLIYLFTNYEGRWDRCLISLNDTALNQA